MAQYLIDRLGEVSTWRGMMWMVTALLIAGNPYTMIDVLPICLGIIGLIDIVTRERWSGVKQLLAMTGDCLATRERSGDK